MTHCRTGTSPMTCSHWRLPNRTEWAALATYYIDGTEALREIGETYWSTGTTCTNQGRFNARGGGMKDSAGTISGILTQATFWTSDTHIDLSPIAASIASHLNSLELSVVDKHVGASIRCVKN